MAFIGCDYNAPTHASEAGPFLSDAMAKFLEFPL
jgi:hypothetical protein